MVQHFVLFLSLIQLHAAPAPIDTAFGIAWTTGRAITYFALRPKPMRREVMPSRRRARSRVLEAMPTDRAFASTMAVIRSPPASSVSSQAAASSILLGLGA
jgi:hypothetical protein